MLAIGCPPKTKMVLGNLGWDSGKLVWLLTYSPDKWKCAECWGPAEENLPEIWHPGWVFLCQAASCEVPARSDHGNGLQDWDTGSELKVSLGGQGEGMQPLCLFLSTLPWSFLSLSSLPIATFLHVFLVGVVFHLLVFLSHFVVYYFYFRQMITVM